MTDITQISDRCVIRWGDGVATEAREALLARAEKLGHARRARAYKPNYPKERELAEGRGLRAILADDLPEATPGAIWIVRIYYRSMGGETLAFQTAPITGAAASRLQQEHGPGPSDALGTDKFRADEPGRIPPLWRGARLVILPSQVPQSADRQVEVTLPLVIPVETVVPVADPPRRPRDLYREAMARRAARSGASRIPEGEGRAARPLLTLVPMPA